MLCAFCWDPDGIGHPGAIRKRPTPSHQSVVPVFGLRHSTWGEVVIKQKLIRGKERQRGARQWGVREKAVPTLISEPSMACLSFKSLRLGAPDCLSQWGVQLSI